MNQRNKRIIAAAMSLTMLATATPISPLYNAIQNAVSSTMIQANAGGLPWETIGNSGLVWAIENTTLKIATKNGITNTDMPDWGEDYTQPWRNSAFTSVEIDEGVTSIGSNAFRNCKNFTSVKIPASVTSINKSAFYICSALNSVTFADSSKLNTIGEFAFGYTSITDITIPDTVTAIGANAFISCSSLRDITAPCAVKSNEADWKISIAKVTYKHILGEGSDTCVCDEKMKKCGDNAFYKLVDGILTIEGTGAIANSAFERNKEIKSVVIGEGITGIGNFAFSNSSLTDITLPDSLKGIGNGAFYGCTNLTTITIPDSVTEIGGNAFGGCTNLSSITAPCTLKSTVEIWKENCNATVSYNHVIQTVGTTCACEEASKCGDNACYTLDETTGVLTIYGEGKINDKAFNGNKKIKSVIIGKGITGIGNQTFGNCSSLESVIAVEGSKLATIDDNAFRFSSEIKTMEFPCTVKENESSWKAPCTTAKVTYTHIFNHIYTSRCDCQACSTIGGKNLYYTLADNKLTIDLIDKSITDENKNAMPDWVSVSNVPWNNQKASITSVEIKEGVTSIGAHAFEGCSSLTSITIPDSVTSIGDSAFTDCVKLTSVGSPSSVTTIGDSAFSSCESLTSVEIPSSVTTIGECAFFDCASLSSVTFANGSKLTTIGEKAFGKCIATNITIPDSVTSLGSKVFSTPDLTSITAPCTLKESVGTWKEDCSATVTYTHPIKDGDDFCACHETTKLPTFGDNLYYKLDETTGKLTIGLVKSDETDKNKNAMPDWTFVSNVPWNNQRDSITSVEIGKGVTHIGNNAFFNSSNLESIEFADGSQLETIGINVFYDCDKLDNVIIPDSVTSIGDSAFGDCAKLSSITAPCTLIATVNSWLNDCSATVTYTHTIKDGDDFCACHETTKLPTFGDNLYYKLDETTGKLTIGLVKSDETDKNKNAMPDWEWDKAPWNGKEITSVVIEKGVTRIGNCAFPACGVTGSVSIPDSVESIGNQAFYGNSFTSITIPGSVKTIEDNAFTECGALETVTLNEGIEKISENTFGYCSSLEKITIPSSVKTIGDAAFLNCKKLSEITFAGSKPEFLNNPELDQYELDAFSGVNTEENPVITLRYPKDDTTWETFLNDKTGEFDWEGGKFKAEPYLNWNNIDKTALRWAISANGTLYIDKQENPSSENYTIPAYDDVPWKDSINKIRFVDISSDVAGVSTTSFKGFNAPTILVLENESTLTPIAVEDSNYDTLGGGQFIYSKSQLTGASLSLDGQIGVNVSFYVNEDEGSTITIDGETVDLSKCECNNNIYTYTLWVAPKDAYNNIEFKTEKDGTPIVEQTFNVKTDYVNVVLADTEHKDYNIRICDMVTALDTYINSSRVYFGIETDSDKITEINSAIDNIAVTIPGKTGNPVFNETMYYGSSLILDSGVKIRHYIKIENESDIEKIKINVGENEYGSEALTKTTINSKEVYYFETEELNPKKFTKNVSVKCGDTNIIDNYCVLTFIKLALNNEDTKKAELGKICKAIFNFYDTVSD